MLALEESMISRLITGAEAEAVDRSSFDEGKVADEPVTSWVSGYPDLRADRQMWFGIGSKRYFCFVVWSPGGGRQAAGDGVGFEIGSKRSFCYVVGDQ
jgi:hypothetical protein